MAAETCHIVKFSRDPSITRIEGLKQQLESPSNRFSESGDNSFGIFYIICILLSLLTYVFDIVLACVLLYYYAKHDDENLANYGLYFAFTLTFLLIPALFVTTVSLRWYINDHDDSSLGRTSLCHWIIRIVFLLFQLSPILRYIDTLVYGIKSKIAAFTDDDNRQTNFYRRMLDEDTNSALLRLFHSFLHCAPQALIQLVILLRHSSCTGINNLPTDIMVMQSWTVLASLISIAWSLTSYHRSVRHARDDKDKIKWGGTIIAFFWQLMSVFSRVLALSLLASIFPIWMGCICALHWGVMSTWLALGQHQTAACSSRCEELLLSAALGLAYVFAFISARDGPTRYVYLAYYLVCFMENTGALVVWCVTKNSTLQPWLYYGTVGGQVLAFLLAIALLLVYYKVFHPAKLYVTKVPEDLATPEVEKPSFSKTNTRMHS